MTVNMDGHHRRMSLADDWHFQETVPRHEVILGVVVMIELRSGLLEVLSNSV